MPGKLKPLDVERETRSGKYPDGDGLYLIVASPTSKNWSYRYWKDGKQRWLGLGSLKEDARLARDAARLRVKGDRSTLGVDIVQEKRAAREEEGRRDQAQSACLRRMRRNLHTRALVDLEQEASQSMAVVAQTVRLPDNRKTHDPGDQAQPRLRIVAADLG
jgi:hypothetical protein